jgi:hypothetical protein
MVQPQIRAWYQFGLVHALILLAVVAVGIAAWRVIFPPRKPPRPTLVVSKISGPEGRDSITYWVSFPDGTLNTYTTIVQNGQEQLFAVGLQNATGAKQFSGTNPIRPQMREAFAGIRRLAQEKLNISEMPSAEPDIRRWKDGFPHRGSVELEQEPPRAEWPSTP